MMIKSERKTQARHVACMAEKRKTYKIFVGKLGCFIKMDLGKMKFEGVDWIYLLRIGTSCGLCEPTNALSGTINAREFLTN